MKTHEERIIELELLVKKLVGDVEKLNKEIEELRKHITWDRPKCTGSVRSPYTPGKLPPLNC